MFYQQDKGQLTTFNEEKIRLGLDAEAIRLRDILEDAKRRLAAFTAGHAGENVKDVELEYYPLIRALRKTLHTFEQYPLTCLNANRTLTTDVIINLYETSYADDSLQSIIMLSQIINSACDSVKADWNKGNYAKMAAKGIMYGLLTWLLLPVATFPPVFILITLPLSTAKLHYSSAGKEAQKDNSELLGKLMNKEESSIELQQRPAAPSMRPSFSA